MQTLIFVLIALSAQPGWGYVKGSRNQDYNQQFVHPSRLQQGTLRQVHIIFRHGDRAPIGTYPNDPNKNYDWPFGRAQLTDVGKRQHYELGNFLRNRYYQFLTTDPREVVARSSDKDRCLASIQSNLAGFYRPSGKWVWNPQLPWQPVPIHSAPGESDWLLNEDAKCPAADEIKKNVMRTQEGLRYAQKYQRLFEYVSENSGKTVNDPSSVLSVYGITYINKLNNLTIPDWVDHIWKEFTHAADDAFTVSYSSKSFNKLRGGPLLGHIIDHMKKYDEEDHSIVQPKAYMYSTHDATIAAFMNAVGVFNGLQVPYAATIIVELHEHYRPVNKYTVRMYYRNTTLQEPYPLVVPNCQQDCPLTDYEALLQDVIPRDIKTECYPTTKQEPNKESLTSSQCCCCNQCGSSFPTASNLGHTTEKLTQGQVGEPRARMQELLMQMREVLDQHRWQMDRSIQELMHDMDNVDQGMKRAKSEYKDTAERLNHYSQTKG